MGKYKDNFVIGLSQCADEQHKFIVMIADVLKNYNNDANLRPLRENAATLARATHEFMINAQASGVFEPEPEKSEPKRK